MSDVLVALRGRREPEREQRDRSAPVVQALLVELDESLAGVADQRSLEDILSAVPRDA